MFTDSPSRDPRGTAWRAWLELCVVDLFIDNKQKATDLFIDNKQIWRNLFGMSFLFGSG